MKNIFLKSFVLLFTIATFGINAFSIEEISCPKVKLSCAMKTQDLGSNSKYATQLKEEPLLVVDPNSNDISNANCKAGILFSSSDPKIYYEATFIKKKEYKLKISIFNVGIDNKYPDGSELRGYDEHYMQMSVIFPTFSGKEKIDCEVIPMEE